MRITRSRKGIAERECLAFGLRKVISQMFPGGKAIPASEVLALGGERGLGGSAAFTELIPKVDGEGRGRSLSETPQGRSVTLLKRHISIRNNGRLQIRTGKGTLIQLLYISVA